VLLLAVAVKLVQGVILGNWVYPAAGPIGAALAGVMLLLHHVGRRGALRLASAGLVATLFVTAELTQLTAGLRVVIAYMTCVLVLQLANALLGARVAVLALVAQCVGWVVIFVLTKHRVVHPDVGTMHEPTSAGDVLDYAIPAVVITAVAWASTREPSRSVDETLTGNSAGSPLRRLRTRTLTIREVQVVQLVAAGKTDDRIARELFISVRTVHSHVTNAMRKTDSANRTALGVLAVREGLVPLDDDELEADAG
jgi:two-component system, NarL family, response regulator LiaR